MGDEVSGTLEGKCLSTLRVVDLKMELEKRGLSKSGSKKDLIKRLKQKLELEKLYEESSAATGENELKLQLDEATEQNEFVKQYLAEQQKLFASQREVRRLIELEERGEFRTTDDSDSDVRDSDTGNKEQDLSTKIDKSETGETNVNIPNVTCDSTTLSEDNEEEINPSKSESEEEEEVVQPKSESEEETVQDKSESEEEASPVRMDTDNIPVIQTRLEYENKVSIKSGYRDKDIISIKSEHKEKEAISIKPDYKIKESTSIKSECKDKELISIESKCDDKKTICSESDHDEKEKVTIEPEYKNMEVILPTSGEEIIPTKLDPETEVVSKKLKLTVEVTPENINLEKNVIKPDSRSDSENKCEETINPSLHVKENQMNVIDDMREEGELVLQENSAEIDLQESSPMNGIDDAKEELVIQGNLNEADLQESRSPTNEVNDTREEGELVVQNNSSEIDVPLEKISYRKLNIPFKRSESTDKSKRKRWSSKNAVQKSAFNISSESLKNLIPEFHLTPSTHTLEVEESAPKSPNSETNKLEPPQPKILKKTVTKKIDDDKARFSCAVFSNALSTFHETKPKRKPSGDSSLTKVDKVTEKPEVTAEPEKPSETSNPTSCIIFIQNLVRPFTLTQLKDMLSQTGTIVEDGFWIDKIKSKCFVKYENEEQATKTREALNGSKWPSSNPKILSVEFATEKEFDLHSKVYEFPKPPPELIAAQQEDERKREELHRRKERRSREKERIKHVREWDKDKVVLESPERENIRPLKELDRSSERKRERRDSKKKPLEETPAKLLDDLFYKTKATPCIYWLPLTEEQAKKKEEERRQRRLDREKRNREEEEHRAKRKASKSRSRSRTRRR